MNQMPLHCLQPRPGPGQQDRDGWGPGEEDPSSFSSLYKCTGVSQAKIEPRTGESRKSKLEFLPDAYIEHVDVSEASRGAPDHSVGS